MSRHPVSPGWVVAAVAGWLATAGNVALWRRLQALGMAATVQDLPFALALAAIVAGVLAILLGLFAWRATLKPAATLLLVTAGAASYFMLAYGVVIDPGMMANAVQTDWREASGLASWQLAATLAALGLLPAWLLWRQPVAYGSCAGQAARGLAIALAGLLLAAGAGLLAFQPLASLMRNHKEIRYLLNPLAPVYSAARVAALPWAAHDQALVRVGEDATLPPLPVSARQRPRLLLLVLGETARSDNFSINGYARATTPELARLGAVSLRNAWSCGTSTAASVPCMFSGQGHAGYAPGGGPREGLLDVLQRAGLAVLWLDNQSGCKGVCDRVPSASTADAAACGADGCLDEALLQGLDARIARLEPDRVARGVVLVLHQMGSHGPGYHLRSPAAHKRFLPECRSPALQDCTRQEVLNAYDNSIAYTDWFLGRAIAWLSAQEQHADTALLYVSDHGESLGEGNLYLHGMPYAIAPDVQKHVPWVSWFSAGFQRAAGLSVECLQRGRDTRITHDHYFHSVLGLMQVRTRAYQAPLDAYAPCRGAAT